MKWTIGKKIGVMLFVSLVMLAGIEAVFFVIGNTMRQDFFGLLQNISSELALVPDLKKPWTNRT